MTVPFVRAILTEILVFLCFKITFSMSNWPHKQILWRGFDPFTFAIVKSAPFDINKSTNWCWFVFTARCTFVSVKYAFFIHVLSSNNEQKFASALYSNNTLAASRLSLGWFFYVSYFISWYRSKHIFTRKGSIWNSSEKSNIVKNHVIWCFPGRISNGTFPSEVMLWPVDIQVEKPS